MWSAGSGAGRRGPPASTLAPGEDLVVYTGDAAPPDGDLDAGVRALSLGYERAVIANDGSDAVTLVADLGVVSDWSA